MSVNPEESLAPAAGNVEDDGVRELHPVVMWGKNDDEYDLYDFRGRPEVVEPEEAVEVVVDPKASHAAGSALAAIYETLKTPDIDFSPSKEPDASVEKVTIPVPEPTIENGLPTGSETEVLNLGKTEPSVKK